MPMERAGTPDTHGAKPTTYTKTIGFSKGKPWNAQKPLWKQQQKQKSK